MLFRRRRPDDLWDRVRTALWPRRSFARSMQYFAKRVLRLTATPHAVAAGVAAGVFASFLPFVGFHFVIALAVAFVLRGNLIAALIGTGAGNPLTFPLIWPGTLALGRLVLHGRQADDLPAFDVGRLLSGLDLTQLWEPFVKPMTVGGTLLGIVFGLAFYALAWWAVTFFRAQRRRMLASRARRRAARLHLSRAGNA